MGYFFRIVLISILLLILKNNAIAQRKPIRQKPASIADSVTFPGYRYYKAGKFKRWLLGANYRHEWVQPLRVRVFDIKKELGGLTIEEKGGGMQTKSLRLVDKDGNTYVLRSIEKFPDNNIPEEFRQTIVKDVLVDGISASYPYAALSIPTLADAANVPHAEPKLVYVPDDPNLGTYRADFANTLCIFEEKEPGGFEKNIGTDKVLEKILNDNDNKIDQQAVLKARLFDMFIMDFDRHEDQWRWGSNDTGEHKTYFPVPRDRDQAFFVNNGFIPRIVKKYFPKFQGFRAKAINISTFNFNARYFDRTFLNALTEDDWKKQADTLLAQMTDDVIEKALLCQPREIYPYSAQKIIDKLKERRKYLKKEAVEYYHFLSEEVDIPGTEKKDFFEISRNKDRTVRVTIYKVRAAGKKEKLYDRLFMPSETKEIRMYGLGEADTFVVKNNESNKIRIRIIGGKGNDVFKSDVTNGVNKIAVYDQKSEKNELIGTGFQNRFSHTDTVNKYDRRQFQYDRFLAGKTASFNLDDGLFVGLTFKHEEHGFRKNPFKLKQQLTVRVALATGAVNSRYSLEARDVIGKCDLLINGKLNFPRNTINFFGLGNDTRFDNINNKSIRFYRTRFNHSDVSVLLRHQFGKPVNFTLGPVLDYYSLERKNNEGRISNYPSRLGLDSISLYGEKLYLGAQAGVLINTRDNDIIPTRGIKWETSMRYRKGLGRYTTNYTEVLSDLSLFFTPRTFQKLVFGLRFGGGMNIGAYKFYQAQFLSGVENLRGYRKYRFAGDKMLYNNIEARLRLSSFETYLFPGTMGLLVFHDVGRVWVKNESSDKWHSGYGGGIWLSPAGRLVVTAAYGWSKEGGLPFVTFGFQF